jgi:pimeloyl-ACP methyl ester carboxylesterase
LKWPDKHVITTSFWFFLFHCPLQLFGTWYSYSTGQGTCHIYHSVLLGTMNFADGTSVPPPWYSDRCLLCTNNDFTLPRCQIQGIPICLMYGKEDPWVTPIWGLQVKRKVPDAPYYEISPAGHCPHDEVPEVMQHAPFSVSTPFFT